MSLSGNAGTYEAAVREQQHAKAIDRANRMLSGTAYFMGVLGGLRLLHMLRGVRCQARSPETNLDLDRIATHASRAVVYTLLFNVGALGVFLLQLLTWKGRVGPVFWMLAPIGAGLVAYEWVYFRWSNARHFLKREYEPDAPVQPLRALARFFKKRILQSGPTDNVIVFGGYKPFLGAGRNVSGWVLAFDRKPDLKTGENPGQRIPIPVEDFYRAADESLERQYLTSLQACSLLFVRGNQLEGDGELLARPETSPVEVLPEERLWELGQGSLGSSRRLYRRYRYVDTARDMVFSYYLRFYNVGSVTFAEGAAYMLPGVDEQRYGLTPLLRDIPATRWAKTVLLGIVLIPFYPLVVAYHLGLFVYQLLWWLVEDLFQLWELRGQEDYNYGLVQTFRESVAAPIHQDYFGAQDLTLYWRATEEAVINGVIEMLKQRGVDVSQFESQATTIINSGIMVSGGRFTATQVAVGSGSSAWLGTPAAEVPKIRGWRRRLAQGLKRTQGQQLQNA